VDKWINKGFNNTCENRGTKLKVDNNKTKAPLLFLGGGGLSEARDGEVNKQVNKKTASYEREHFLQQG
jgi:hypothetical protein